MYPVTGTLLYYIISLCTDITVAGQSWVLTTFYLIQFGSLVQWFPTYWTVPLQRVEMINGRSIDVSLRTLLIPCLWIGCHHQVKHITVCCLTARRSWVQILLGQAFLCRVSMSSLWVSSRFSSFPVYIRLTLQSVSLTGSLVGPQDLHTSGVHRLFEGQGRKEGHFSVCFGSQEGSLSHVLALTRAF